MGCLACDLCSNSNSRLELVFESDSGSCHCGSLFTLCDQCSTRVLQIGDRDLLQECGFSAQATTTWRLLAWQPRPGPLRSTRRKILRSCAADDSVRLQAVRRAPGASRAECLLSTADSTTRARLSATGLSFSAQCWATNAEI